MKAFKRVAPIALLVVLCACGQLVEFGAEGDSGAEDASAGKSGSGGKGGAGGAGRAGASGHSGSGGKGGASGNSDDAGVDVDASMDTTRPTVEATSPTRDASGVSVTTSVTATFSENVEPGSVSDAFRVTQGSTPVPGTVTVLGDTVTFVPSNSLSDDTTYTVKVSTAAKDRAGNALAADYTWTFSTIANTAPTVVSTSPTSGATAVAISTHLTVVFSETMAPLSIVGAFSLMKGANSVAGVAVLVGNTATFTPTNPLDQNALYTASVSTAVTDLAGAPLASAHTWTFTTGDGTAPTVSSTLPALAALDVPTSTAISATFSENMDPLSTAAAFTLMDGPNAVAATVTVVGDTATLMPTNPLDEDTIYTAKIATTATDSAGNHLALLYSWTFSTSDHLAPSVIDTNPRHLDVQVPVNHTITATFDDDINGSTITDLTFTLTSPGPVSVAGMVSYNMLTRTASFDPDQDLMTNIDYRATLTTSVMDTSGNALTQDKVWLFKTGTAAAQTVKQLTVQLGSVGPFAILAQSGIMDIPSSIITGDVGLSPAAGALATGFSVPLLCPEIIGKLYVVDVTGPACAVPDPPRLDSAKLSAISAFADAINSLRGSAASISGNLNGLTLYPGLYESLTSVSISAGGFLYLDAQWNPDAVFVIRSATTITTLATSQVVLTKGAKAANIFWTAGSAITLGTNSIMKGSMLAGTAISLLNHANLEGRLITQGSTGTAVTLDQVTVTLPLP